MHCEDDTIAAISTPPGFGGIGIVRLSGIRAVPIAEAVFVPKTGIPPSESPSYSMTYGHIIDPGTGVFLDEVILSVMRAPRSYTREDVVEINCHGGMITIRKVLELALAHGARLAEPGEFTKRAFLNGRIGLVQAEAVMDLIEAKTFESMQIAVDQLRGGLSERLAAIRDLLIQSVALLEAFIDFPEEDIEPASAGQLFRQIADAQNEIRRLSDTFEEARFFRTGLAVAIVGRPNVGKSSLLNALLRKDRAIVSSVPGTTRDLIEEYLNIRGLPVRIIDTAGIRHSSEEVELEGIRRSIAAAENADFVIAVLDGSEPLREEDFDLLGRIHGKSAVIAVNKSDLPSAISPEEISALGRDFIFISAAREEGLGQLKHAIVNSNLSGRHEERHDILVTNVRHKMLLDKASVALERASAALKENSPPEICSIEMREAMDSIGEITGAVTADDVLNTIFSNFCIGK